LNKISRFAIEHFTTKAKLPDFRPIILYITVLGSAVSIFKSPASNYRGFGASTSDSHRFTMEHRSEIDRFFDRTATNMQNLKKKLRTGREFVDTWHAQLQT
jgi:hypothetical protein